MNISEALKALSSQAPSSKLMPTCPFKSARPRVSMRPVRVTSPAPMTTPRIPRRGLVETSDGMAAAAPRAMSAGVGRTAMLEAVMIFRLLSRPDGGDDRKSGAQFRGESCVVQHDLDRDTLHDLGEIAGRIVRGQQGKLRPAGGRDLQDLTANYLPGILVNAKFGRITNLHVGQLRFPIVRLHPLRDINKRNHLCAGRNKLPGPHLPFTYVAVPGRVNFGVAEVHIGCRECRLFREPIGLKLHILRFENAFGSVLGFGTELAAGQHGLSLIESSVSAGKMCLQLIVIGHGGLECLLRRRMSLI